MVSISVLPYVIICLLYIFSGTMLLSIPTFRRYKVTGSVALVVGISFIILFYVILK